MRSSFEAILSTQTPVLVDFYADWCQPCKILAPILGALKHELGATLKIIKIDVDKNQSLAARYHVRSVPTLILFKDKQPVWRQAGVLQKTDLHTALKPYL
ncbi:thioredoxin [Arenibacter sp. GZD96]|uniref:thioredoxin n=1 Tax=Aurantibrevibacter litoralis TaxID=3106030 RepID=UPI002B0018C3|nr:thioredoxin [Arenibacter sp. GZD-96]MEA1785187.1 thioredoxin [Arenibacter sp. GZD-96]